MGTIRLYKFIPEEYGIQTILNKRIKLSHISELNDPFELMGIAFEDRELRAGFNFARTLIADRWRLLCLSNKWSNPLLWSHYADNHRGLCLGFDASTTYFKPINYQSRRFRVSDFDISDASDLTAKDIKTIIFTKFSAWRYESEHRAIIMPHECIKKDKIEFFRFNDQFRLREVIVGASSRLTRAELNSILENSAHDVQLRKARPAFRTFKMVNQRSKNIW